MTGQEGYIGRLRGKVVGMLRKHAVKTESSSAAKSGRASSTLAPLQSENDGDAASRQLADSPKASQTIPRPIAASEVAAKPLPLFDRELEQYDIAAAELAARRSEIQEKMDDCRDGGDRLADFPQYWAQFKKANEQQSKLIADRQRYIADRDRLTAWGCTDAWVVAGSIVTVRFYDGDESTFVLTDRPSDTELEPVPYGSPLGHAVRRRQVGDRVSLPAGAVLTITTIVPGFRLTTKQPSRFARKLPRT